VSVFADGPSFSIARSNNGVTREEGDEKGEWHWMSHLCVLRAWAKLRRRRR
jgi:hypothetical protein